MILGLDPGSRVTGYGIIEGDGERLEHVAHGVLRLNEKASLPERLRDLHEQLTDLFSRYPVKAAAVEKIFFGKNADSAFKLGHARGVCLLISAAHNVIIAEYAARFVKKCVTGSGAADKNQVQAVIFNLLKITPRDLQFDATDALSLAVTHARMGPVKDMLRAQEQEGTP